MAQLRRCVIGRKVTRVRVRLAVQLCAVRVEEACERAGCVGARACLLVQPLYPHASHDSHRCQREARQWQPGFGKHVSGNQDPDGALLEPPHGCRSLRGRQLPTNVHTGMPSVTKASTCSIRGPTRTHTQSHTHCMKQGPRTGGQARSCDLVKVSARSSLCTTTSAH
jgi:hypothetical protein